MYLQSGLVACEWITYILLPIKFQRKYDLGCDRVVVRLSHNAIRIQRPYEYNCDHHYLYHMLSRCHAFALLVSPLLRNLRVGNLPIAEASSCLDLQTLICAHLGLMAF